MPDLRAGGAEQVMLNLLFYFMELNLNVHLLLGTNEGKLKEQLTPKIPIHVLGQKRARNAVIPLIKYCNKYKPDIVLSTLGAAATIGIAKPFIFGKTKFICRLGNTLSAESALKKSIIKKELFFLANKFTYKHADSIICQSKYMKEDAINFLKCSPNKIKVIYNPLNISKIQKLSLEKAPQYDLLAIGRLMEEKDYFTLINSVDLLIQENFFIKLGIIGEGPLQNDLQKLVVEKNLKQNITFLGFQSNPYKFLCRAKFLVSSSLYEGFSNVIIEALSLGIPVIATDCPSGNREVIKEGYNGFFTKVGSAEDMANTIKKAFSLRENLQMESSKKDISTVFDISNIGNQYLNLFNDLIL